MQTSASVGWAGVVALCTVSVIVPRSATRAQSPAPAASSATDSGLVCGNTPYCAETNDFAAVVTNFRTSELRGYKVIDAVVRFRNKTAKPLILAYAQGSGTAVDDKGNRYVVYGANGVRGIGQVYGSTFDPKFSLQPGGTGDAQFELMWYPGQQIYGFQFELNLTVNTVNSYEGNQHSLGGEFPLHYEKLANGVSSTPTFLAGLTSGAGASAPAPCANGAGGTAAAMAGATGSAGIQKASDQAQSAVATATTAVVSLKGIFGHKKSVAAKPAAQEDDPCAHAASTASSAAPSSQTTPSAAAPQSAPAAPGATAATTTTTATGSVQLPAGARTASPAATPAATAPHAANAPRAVPAVKAAPAKKPVTPAAASAKKPAPKDTTR